MFYRSQLQDGEKDRMKERPPSTQAGIQVLHDPKSLVRPWPPLCLPDRDTLLKEQGPSAFVFQRALKGCPVTKSQRHA